MSAWASEPPVADSVPMPATAAQTNVQIATDFANFFDHSKFPLPGKVVGLLVSDASMCCHGMAFSTGGSDYLSFYVPAGDDGDIKDFQVPVGEKVADGAGQNLPACERR